MLIKWNLLSCVSDSPLTPSRQPAPSSEMSQSFSFFQFSKVTTMLGGKSGDHSLGTCEQCLKCYSLPEFHRRRKSAAPPHPPESQSARHQERRSTGKWDARQADLFSTSHFILCHISAARTIPLVVGWEPARVVGRGLGSSPLLGHLCLLCVLPTVCPG